MSPLKFARSTPKERQAANRCSDTKPEKQLIKAPLLQQVTECFVQARRIYLIDLSTLRPGILHCLSGLHVRLDVLGLDDCWLEGGNESVSSETFHDRFKSRLPDPNGELADVLLCWNFLNYLSPPEITATMDILLPRLSSQVEVHAVIESSAVDMPARPDVMSLSSGGIIESWPYAVEFPDRTDSHRDSESLPDHNRIPAPRHSTDVLQASMPGLVAEQTVLLGNGQKEYLFRRS